MLLIKNEKGKISKKDRELENTDSLNKGVKVMEIKDAILAHMEAEQGGSILVRCEGGYVARFTLSYKYEGHDFSKHSGDITLGVAKSESLPAGSTEIHLKVEEYWGFGWSTIFTKDYREPITKCFKVYGTTLAPKYAEISC